MKYYDVNLTYSKHVVRVTFMVFQYSGTVTFEIGGNCSGKSILESGIEFLNDAPKIFENDCCFIYHEEDDTCSMKLHAKDSADVLEIDHEPIDEAENYIVAVEIVDRITQEC